MILTSSKHNKDHRVAIKCLVKQYQQSLEEILEEFHILSHIDHPNIVRYIETYNDDKFVFLVMEYVDGGSLFDQVHIKKELAGNDTPKFEKVLKGYMHGLFKACSHIHSQKVIHRDIKPENLMINKDGDVKLIDFGLSRVKNDDLKI